MFATLQHKQTTGLDAQNEYKQNILVGLLRS